MKDQDVAKLVEELTEEERRYRARRAKAKRLAIKKRKRQRRIRLLVCTGILIIGMAGIIHWADSKKTSDTQSGEVSINQQELDGINNSFQGGKDVFLYESEFADFFEQNKPEIFEKSQIYKRLKELVKDYPQLKEIYDKKDEYPEKVLASLCNNPEMYAYVEGYLNYAAGDRSVVTEAVLSEEEKKQRYPLFLQWDARWGYEEYGDFNIALSGCGPTTLAMALVAVTGDTSITPDDIARYSMDNGFYVEGTGTAWSLMTEGAKDYNVKARELSLDEQVMKNALDAGKVIICSMRPGDFTAVGHFVMIYDYDVNGFKVNDPNCIYRSSRYWSYEELSGQIRILWSYENV